jgi:hypothetical protein
MNDLRTTERNLPPTHVLPFAPSPSHSAKPGVYTESTVFEHHQNGAVPVLLANFVNFRIYSQTHGACGRVGGRIVGEVRWDGFPGWTDGPSWEMLL